MDKIPSLLQFFNKDAQFGDGSGQGRPPKGPTVATEMDLKSTLTRLNAILAKIPTATDKPVKAEVGSVEKAVKGSTGQIAKVSATLTLSREDENRNALMMRALLERNHKQSQSQLRALERALRNLSAGSANFNLGGRMRFPFGGNGNNRRGLPVPYKTGGKSGPGGMPPVDMDADRDKKTNRDKRNGTRTRGRKGPRTPGSVDVDGWTRNADGTASKTAGGRTQTYAQTEDGNWEWKKDSFAKKTATPKSPTPPPATVTQTRPMSFFEGVGENLRGGNLVRAGDQWIDPSTKTPATKTVSVAQDVSGVPAKGGKSLLGKAGGAAARTLGKVPFLGLAFGAYGAYDGYENAGETLGIEEDQLSDGNRKAAAAGGALDMFDPLQTIGAGASLINYLAGTSLPEDLSIGKTLLGYKNNADMINSAATSAGLIDPPKKSDVQKQKEVDEELTKKLAGLTSAVEDSTKATEGLEEGLEAAGLKTAGAEAEALAEAEKGPLMALFANMRDVLSGKKALSDATGGPGPAPTLGSPATPSDAAPSTPIIPAMATAGAVAGGVAAVAAPKPMRGKAGLFAGVVGATTAGVAAMTTRPETAKGDAKAAKGLNKLQENPAVSQAIIDAAIARGEDPALMLAIAEKESSFNPNAKAGTSSAKGLYQFLDGTWAAETSKMGMQGANQFDPTTNAQVGAFHTNNNRKALEKHLGRPVNAGEVYGAHFLGLGGAKQYFAARDKNPDGIAAEMAPAAAAANKSVYYHKGADGKPDLSRPKTFKEIQSQFFDPMNAKAEGYASLLAQGKIPGSEKTAYAQSPAAPTLQTGQQPTAMAAASPPPPVTMAGNRAEAKTPNVIVQAPPPAPQKAPIPAPPPATTAVASAPSAGSIPTVFTDADIFYG